MVQLQEAVRKRLLVILPRSLPTLLPCVCVPVQFCGTLLDETKKATQTYGRCSGRMPADSQAFTLTRLVLALGLDLNLVTS